MLKYIKHLLESGSTFTVEVWFPDDTRLDRRVGVFGVDEIGIVIEGEGVNDARAVPWSSIAALNIEISEDLRSH